MRTPGWVSVAMVAALSVAVLSVPAAGASQPTTASSGSLGEVDAVIDGEPVVQEPIAPCDVAGDQTNSSDPVIMPDVASYHGGSTACAWDELGEATVEVSGRRFLTDVLVEWGGPRISVRSFSVSCQTTGNGSAGWMQVRGVRGIDVPEQIPPNYTVTIPGRIEGAAPLATVVVNEVITPDPPDGGMTMRAMRIQLFPDGGPHSGDIIVGTAGCGPGDDDA